ncbi:hypothetical protein DYB25_004720 [Aphanomyces astaci]|uniref:Anoctamin transmembrane domain-containing protein n=1 Tax=Aphanomyces astaci TaxID=112090 RepID=A0A397AHH1_APHAT|nr:hypothetical protein DYB25_004720 [Aphanomyces astaci]
MDLLEACENGNEERVVEILLEAGPTKAPAMLQQVDQAGRSALHAACIGGQLSVVRLLLGRECQVFFPGRSREDTEDLLVPCGPNVKVVMKRKEDAHVPSALLQLPREVVVQAKDLANGIMYLDYYGNAPIQCISCFGCGTEMKHVRDSVEIAAELLRSGCQCNTSKTANNWTPLHWSAFNGHHDLTALLLNPQLCCDEHNNVVSAVQFAVPLVCSEALYPVDVAGRMGLQLRDEMAAWKQSLANETTTFDGFEIDYRDWRLHLDHVLVVKEFVRDYVAQAHHPYQYAQRLAKCVEASSSKMKPRRKRPVLFTEADIVRYGQHLLYWCAGLNMLDEAIVLLNLTFQNDTTTTTSTTTTRLAPLYPIQYEDCKSQSALHFACIMGHTTMVHTLLTRVIALYTSSASLAKTPSSTLPSKVHPVLRGISAKDIPFTALAGWLNHRLETPLYLAGLYNRADVATSLLSILPPTTVQTELHVQNIEGSTLSDMANDAVRTALNLATTALFPHEYVLVFRRKYRLFRKTLQDVLEEESSRAPSLLAASVGSTQQLRRWRDPDVVLNLIRDNVNLKCHLQRGTIFDLFPLHDVVGHNAIAAHWVLGHGVMLVLVWITFLVERWKRKRAEMLCNWGLPAPDGGSAGGLVSAEFHGDFVVDTTTNERIVEFPMSVRTLRIYVGMPLLMAMVALAVLSFIGMKDLRARNAAASSDDTAAFMPVISALNAVAIILLDKVYSKVAHGLTHWENHRTVSDFESMLALKLFWFKFINAFMSLFWTAFVDREFDRLRYDLMTILFFRQASTILMSNLVPLLQVRYRAAVTVNCALLYLTTDIHAYLPTSFFAADAATSTAKLWVLLGVEHLVLGIKAAMALGIPDSPPWVDAYYAKLAKTHLISPPPTRSAEATAVGAASNNEDKLGSFEVETMECMEQPTVDTKDSGQFDIARDDQVLFALPPESLSTRTSFVDGTTAIPATTSSSNENIPSTYEQESLTIQALQIELAAMQASRDAALARIRVLESRASTQDDGSCGFCDGCAPCTVKCVECKASMCYVVQERLAHVEKLLQQPSGIQGHTSPM